MNIFYLDTRPRISAQYHCDKHVVKMILESAQMICTVANELTGKQVAPYKSTHKNHPCVKWMQEDYINFSYVLNLMWYLDEERKYRFGSNKTHTSVEKIHDSGIITLIMQYLPERALTEIPLCMPDACKVRNDAVQSYRNYYVREKKHLHKWTRRGMPYWLINTLTQ